MTFPSGRCFFFSEALRSALAWRQGSTVGGRFSRLRWSAPCLGSTFCRKEPTVASAPSPGPGSRLSGPSFVERLHQVDDLLRPSGGHCSCSGRNQSNLHSRCPPCVQSAPRTSTSAERASAELFSCRNPALEFANGSDACRRLTSVRDAHHHHLRCYPEPHGPFRRSFVLHSEHLFPQAQ